MPTVAPSSEDRLDSWKEIAAYLKRGERTVRRWEREEGLPVHRHVHRVLGSVYAFKSEIETWRQAAARHERQGSSQSRRDLRPEVAPSIAVLPFRNLSADADDEYFADGLADEVTAALANVRSLRVISRTSSSRFKGTTKDIRAIARELGVRYVLEGSVRRAQDTLRISARLIDGVRDEQLWAGTRDGRLDDVFAIQERLAQVIVEALELRLTVDERRRLADRPIGDVHAYDCYLRARQEAWRWRRDSIEHAIQLLRNGLAIVGENARLYAALGHAYLQYREAGIDLSDGPLDDAEACARRVFALDPDSASARQLRGWIHYGRARIQDAVRDLKSALAVEGDNADTLLLLANCYLISGQVTAARRPIDRLIEVDPLTPLTRCMPAFADVMEGKFATAIEPYRQMCDMDPGNPMARLFYVWVLALNGHAEQALAVTESFPLEMRDTLPARVASLLALAANGRETAAARTDEIESVASAADLFPRMLAEGYALAGKRDRAMHWLAIAVDRGFINHPFLAEHDPFFRDLRHTPPFRDLMSIVRDRWEKFEA
jgi:TolB-like protein/thioredoxin-like negative regulator of GroEL